VDREPTLVSSDLAIAGWIVAGIVVVVLAVAFWVWRKGRPFNPGDVFRASRLSRGNRLFPTQVLITSSSVVHFTPQWIGRREKSIHMAHVASVNIDTGVLFSDVVIETSGGEHPVACHGHSKGDAVKMKALIEHHQSAYYRSQGSIPPVVTS
jgi:hypothetical protein